MRSKILSSISSIFIATTILTVQGEDTAPPTYRNEYYPDVPPSYDFNYFVTNDYGNNFGQNEKRDRDTTQGEYHVQLPDGRLQTVKYVVNDPYSGYVAEVSYSGEARYDPPSSYGKHPSHPITYSNPKPIIYKPSKPIVYKPAPAPPKPINTYEKEQEPIQFKPSSNPIIYRPASKPIVYKPAKKPIIYKPAKKPIVYKPASKPVVVQSNSKPIPYQSQPNIYERPSQPIIYKSQVKPVFLKSSPVGHRKSSTVESYEPRENKSSSNEENTTPSVGLAASTTDSYSN